MAGWVKRRGSEGGKGRPHAAAAGKERGRTGWEERR